MSGVPYVFGNATTSIPLSQLDVNFATNATIGTTSVGLGNTTTTLVGLTNVSTTVVNTSNVSANTSLLLQTNGTTTAVTIDTNQNFGLGVTPSAWAGGYKSVDNQGGSFASSGSPGILVLSNNSYNNGTNWIYKASSYATDYVQINSEHRWRIAASGTAGNAITFTQPMTLDVSGNLLVGQPSLSTSNAGVSITGSGYTLGPGFINATVASSTNAASNLNIYSTGAGAYRFYVDMGGTVHATSIVITAISDERLKENVRDIDTALSTIMALKPRRYDWKEGKGLDKKNAAGFIAQEFEQVFPDSVGLSKAGEDGIEYKNINYEELIPTLTKAIQEQQALITQLQADVTALKG